MKLVTIAIAFFAMLQLTAAQSLRAQKSDVNAGFSSAPSNLPVSQVHHDIPTQLDFPALRGSPVGLHLPNPCQCECNLNGNVGIIHVASKNNVEQNEIQCVPPDLSSWALRTKRYECVHCGENKCIDCD
jgi:hypothetical protein